MFQKSLNKYVDTDLSSASISTNYSLSNLNGYISVPIGNQVFMSSTSINNTSVSCAYTLYTGTNDNFALNLFIDPTQTPTATVFFNAPNTTKNNITGHLVVPVFKGGFESNYYYSFNANNTLVLPKVGIPTNLQSQIVYVPKGTSYQVYDKSMNLSNWVGFVTLPVGNTDLLSKAFNNSDINLTVLSQSQYTITD